MRHSDRTVLVVVGIIWALAAMWSCRPPESGGHAVRVCAEFTKDGAVSKSVATLNLISEAFRSRCDERVIAYATQAQAVFRHKTFSITREATNVFVPDGTYLDYVMESYERGYLNVLLAVSYLRMKAIEEAKVELRSLDHELFAPIYNFGEDPVNLLLSAVLWERLGETQEARVDWMRLRDFQIFAMRNDPVLRRFAGERVEQIDDGAAAGAEWHVYQVGRFPQLDWDLRFTNSTSGYFSITPRQRFLPSCTSGTGALVSTESWFNKIAVRHSHAYHPLLNVQTWIRLPIGVIYSLVPVAVGAGVMVGGCMLDAAGDGKGALCELSVMGGMALMDTAPQVLEGALRPDLRHWEEVPAAVAVTTAKDLKSEPCLTRVTDDVRRMF